MKGRYQSTLQFDKYDRVCCKSYLLIESDGQFALANLHAHPSGAWIDPRSSEAFWQGQIDLSSNSQELTAVCSVLSQKKKLVFTQNADYLEVKDAEDGEWSVFALSGKYFLDE